MLIAACYTLSESIGSPVARLGDRGRVNNKQQVGKSVVERVRPIHDQRALIQIISKFHWHRERDSAFQVRNKPGVLTPCYLQACKYT